MTRVLIFEAENTITPLNDGQTPFEVFQYYFGKPRRGDTFQVARELINGTFDTMRVPGSDHTAEVFRPNRQNAQYQTEQVWKWTGKLWKEMRNDNQDSDE